MHKKLPLIIALQAVLIIVLFWVLIFYGRDEYAAYQDSQAEEIESPNRVTENAGVNMVSLNLATQLNSGITTAKVNTASFQGEIKSLGQVVSLDGLIEAKSQYVAIQSNLNQARAASSSNLAQYQRLKALNADDKNISDLAVQQALSMVNTDNAAINAANAQLKNLQNSTTLQWGNTLGGLVFNQQAEPHLANLLTRKNVLVQISLPINAATPAQKTTISLTPLNEDNVIIKAVYVSPAAVSDNNGFGKTFYYSAPAEQLRTGMRVNVQIKNVAKVIANGIVIPSNAVVWYAGKPWAYFKLANTLDNSQKNVAQNISQFVRKPISTDTEVDGGWFNTGLDSNGKVVDSEVVVSGAQLLLSEEFKSLIKNENED